MCLNRVSRLLTSCLVVSSAIFNHLIMEFFSVWVLLTYRFWKNRYSWWPPAEAGYPHSLGCTSRPQAARDPQPQRSGRHGLSAGQRPPSLPSPPQSPGLRADFSGSRGKDKFPALATSPAGTDSLREVTAPARLRAPADSEANGDRHFEAPLRWGTTPTPHGSGAAPQGRRPGGSGASRRRDTERRCATRHSWGAGAAPPRPGRAPRRRERPRVLPEAGAAPRPVRQRRAAVAARAATWGRPPSPLLPAKGSGAPGGEGPRSLRKGRLNTEKKSNGERAFREIVRSKK